MEKVKQSFKDIYGEGEIIECTVKKSIFGRNEFVTQNIEIPAKSYEYSVMRDILFKNVNNAKKIFSISPKDGVSDKKVISKYKPELYAACENVFDFELKNNMFMNPQCNLSFQRDLFENDECVYSCNKDGSKFDLIMMTHCLYNNDKPLKMIKDLLNNLTPEGSLVIFTSSTSLNFTNCLVDVIDFCREKLSLPKNINYFEELNTLIKRSDISQTHSIKSGVESSLINANKIKTDNDVFDFLSYFLDGIDCKWGNDECIKYEILRSFDELRILSLPLLEHYTGYIIISNKQ